MKIVIFGATGRTGLPLVRQALDGGHTVIAFARTPSKLGITNPRLTIVQGDMADADAVAKAIPADADAVISVLAPRPGEEKGTLVRGAQNIITRMKAANLKRLIWMTGAGVDAPEDQPKLINHVIKFALKTMSGETLEASARAVEAVQASGLDWTIVRAPMLTDGAATGKIRVGWVGVNTGPRLARADAATFILGQIGAKDFTRKAPMLSN